MNNYDVADKCINPNLAKAVTGLNGEVNGLILGLKSVVINGKTDNDDDYDIYWMAKTKENEEPGYVDFIVDYVFENSRELVDYASLDIVDIPFNTVFYRKYFPYNYIEDENVGGKIKLINWVITEKMAIKLAIAQGLDIKDQKAEVGLQAFYEKNCAKTFLFHAWYVQTKDDFRLVPVRSGFTRFIEEFGDDKFINNPLEAEDTFLEDGIKLKLWKFREGLQITEVE